MTLKYSGKIIGVWQAENTEFYARFIPDDTKHEIDLPITSKEFYSMKWESTVTMTVEIKD